MGRLSGVTSAEGWKPKWAVEKRLDLETGQSIAAVGQRAIQWGEKREGKVLNHQFEQLQAMSPRERAGYLDFLGSVEKLPKGLQEISNRLSALEKADIEKKSGHIWECTGHSEGIYTFRMKAEYKSQVAFERKIAEISPAVEIDSRYARDMFDVSKANKMVVSKEELSKLEASKDMSLREAYQEYGLSLIPVLGYGKRQAVLSLIYEELGYGAAGTTMRLPDQKELERRWAILQQKNPELADLRVLAAAGIATDEAFVLGHVTHNAVLSADKEFVHDHTVHLASQIGLLVSLAAEGIAYEKYKHSVAQGVFALYKKILSVEHKLAGLDRSFSLSNTELALLKRSMGAIVDLFSAQDHIISPSILRRNVRTVLQNSDYYRSVVKDFGLKTVQRLSLLWTKLELATGPLYGYPVLRETEVARLLREDRTLIGVCSNETVWVKHPSRIPKQLPYEWVNGTRLVINNGEHRFEKEVEIEGQVSQQDLLELSELIERNEEKVTTLVGSLPTRLREGAEATYQAPVRPDEAKGGQFVNWRSKSIYGDGFALSVVTEIKGEKFFKNYVVEPGLMQNVVGFHIEGRRAKERVFIPASSYEQLVLQLEKTGLMGERLGSEIEGNHLDS